MPFKIFIELSVSEARSMKKLENIIFAGILDVFLMSVENHTTQILTKKTNYR